MIKIGNTDLKKICIGNTPLKKVCIGNTVIYDSSSTETPTATSTYTINLSKINGTYMKYVLTPTFARDGKNAVVVAHENVDDYMLKNTFDTFVPNFPFTIAGVNYYTARADTFARTADTTKTQYFVYIIRDGKVVAHGPVLANGTNIKIPDMPKPKNISVKTLGLFIEKATLNEIHTVADVICRKMKATDADGKDVDLMLNEFIPRLFSSENNINTAETVKKDSINFGLEVYEDNAEEKHIGAAVLYNYNLALKTYFNELDIAEITIDVKKFTTNTYVTIVSWDEGSYLGDVTEVNNLDWSKRKQLSERTLISGSDYITIKSDIPKFIT